jgi:hypothetical protein
VVADGNPDAGRRCGDCLVHVPVLVAVSRACLAAASSAVTGTAMITLLSDANRDSPPGTGYLIGAVLIVSVILTVLMMLTLIPVSPSRRTEAPGLPQWGCA